MALKIPRLSKNRLGVYRIRVYFFDLKGKRKLKQYSLRTKDSSQAQRIALQFNLYLESRSVMGQKKTPFEGLLSYLRHTAIDGESIDFDPSNSAEMAFAKQWKIDKDAELANLKKQAFAQGRELTLLEGITRKLLPQQPLIQKGKLFSVATADYLTERKFDNVPETIKEKQRTYKEFIAVYNDLDINQIKKETIISWKASEIKRDLTANRINKKLGQINDFFNWAIKNGLYTASDKSPVDGLFISTKSKLAKSTKKREPFSDDDIKSLFGEGYTKRFFAPDHYWIPLVCLFSGARREEVGDLLSVNVKTVDGVPCFQIEEGKTKDAQRTVPVHQVLIDLGFMEYAKARQEEGHAQLFSHRPKGAGGRAKEAGRMFTLRLRKDCSITSTRKTFHSLRHTVITRLHTADANPAHVKQIAGHSSETTGVHFQTYTHSIGLAQLAETLNRLSYPHDFASLKLTDPTFKAFFAKEKTADEKQAERQEKNAPHLKAKAEGGKRNRGKKQNKRSF